MSHILEEPSNSVQRHPTFIFLNAGLPTSLLHPIPKQFGSNSLDLPRVITLAYTSKSSTDLAIGPCTALIASGVPLAKLHDPL